MKTVPFKVDVSEDLSKSTVHFPGISSESFNASGNISPWALLKILESGRILSSTGSAAFSYENRDDQQRATLFLVEQMFDINWESLLGVTSHKTFPYTVTCDLQAIGQTSFQYKQTMVNSLDGTCLATGFVKAVAVDSMTRRPKDLPRVFKEQFAHLAKDSSPRIYIPDIPVQTFSLPFSVGYSDTDYNKHFNEASFVKYAFNCVWSANQTQTFQYFGKDLSKQPLRTISVLHKGEGREGDQLVSFCWQDNTSPQFVHVVIKNRDKVLAYLKMTFGIEKKSKL